MEPLTHTLEELLEMHGARITSKDVDGYYRVEKTDGSKPFPEDINPLVNSISVDKPMPIHTFSGKIIADSPTPAVISVEFKPDSEEALRALLFISSEKERYKKFCKDIDKDIEQELSED